MRLPGHGHPLFGGHGTASLPNSQRPKARPPQDFRDKPIFPSRTLPTYTGPYAVGTMEIEVPAKNPRVFSTITRHGRHMLQLETVLMNVYYPADTRGYVQKDDPRFSRELWLGRPRLGMASGYGSAGGVGLLGIPVFFPAWFTKLPAYRNAPLASHWSPEINATEGGINVKRQKGEKPPGAPHEPRFPVIMFSHGLAGTRTMYSSQCGEFASYGFIVCAIEHRDGSGPRTFINYSKSGPGSIDDLEACAGIDVGPRARKKGYDYIDYMWPKDNPKDTMPNNEKGVDTELRNAQICLRIAELEEAYSVMGEIAAGNGQLVEDRNLRRKGFKAASSHGLKGVDWPRWKDRICLENVTACGHSFGAATIIEMLRHDDRFHYIKQGIIYDIWGAGTRPLEADAPLHRIRCPVLAINSEAFTYWSSNFDLVTSLIQEAQASPNPCPSWLLTLRGTVHVSQSDFSLLYPHITSLLLKAVANPRRALDLNINASLEFLSLTLPTHLALVNRAYQNEGLLELDVEPLERIPKKDRHEPNQEYIAMRLKIQHEWLYRTNPKLMRRLKRKRNQRKGKMPEAGDEVWLHHKPTQETLSRHLEDVQRRSAVAADKNRGPVPVFQTDSAKPTTAESSSQSEG